MATSSKSLWTRGLAVVAVTCAIAGSAMAQAQDPQAAAQAALTAAAAENRPAFAGYKPGDVRVYMSPALRAAMDLVKPQAEAALGKTLVVEVRQARLLQLGIESGQPFEVALLTKPVMDTVVTAGKVVPASQVNLADVALGMTARGDLSKVDMKTSAGLKKTILGAKTIRRNYGVGASVPLVEHMTKTLGVEAQIKDKIIPMGTGAAAVPEGALAPGEYEVLFNMNSEILSRPNWTYVGAVPEDLRLPTVLIAGVSPQGDKASAEALIKFLKGPVFTKALTDTGMVPVS